MNKDNKTTGVSGTVTTDTTTTLFPKDNIGWICPICGRGVSPTEKFCPCKESETSQSDFPYPTNPYPIWWPQVPMYTDNWWWKNNWWWKQPTITSVTYKTTTNGSENNE